jgi:hypothetical protein
LMCDSKKASQPRPIWPGFFFVRDAARRRA